MINKPAVTPYKYNLDGDVESSKVIATSSHELVSVVVTSTGTSMAVRIYDTADTSHLDNKKSILLAANAGESVPYTPAQPILFKEGIYVVIEQGAFAGGEVFLTYT